MGLDFSHTEARWGYFGFHHARKKLAAVIGIDLDNMAGFHGAAQVKWDSLEPDPIHILLSHSDCDGEISPDDCKKVAPRLRELVQFWGNADSDKHKFLQLADGMDKAAKNNEPLLFR